MCYLTKKWFDGHHGFCLTLLSDEGNGSWGSRVLYSMCGSKAEIKMLNKLEITLNCFLLHLSYYLSLLFALVAKPGGVEKRVKKIQIFMNIITYHCGWVPASPQPATRATLCLLISPLPPVGWGEESGNKRKNSWVGIRTVQWNSKKERK